MNIGYSVNLTDIFIRDNPNATTSYDWDYAKTLTRVTLQRPAALYIIGFIFGVAGIATTLTKIFSRWDVVIGNAVLKFVNIPGQAFGVSSHQLTSNRAQSYSWLHLWR